MSNYLIKYCFSILMCFTFSVVGLMLSTPVQANTVTAVRIWPADITQELR